jgi:hypothetical protein
MALLTRLDCQNLLPPAPGDIEGLKIAIEVLILTVDQGLKSSKFWLNWQCLLLFASIHFMMLSNQPSARLCCKAGWAPAKSGNTIVMHPPKPGTASQVNEQGFRRKKSSCYPPPSKSSFPGFQSAR